MLNEIAVNSVMSGKSYFKAVQAHKAVSEAMEYVRFKHFCSYVAQEQPHNIPYTCSSIRHIIEHANSTNKNYREFRRAMEKLMQSTGPLLK